MWMASPFVSLEKGFLRGSRISSGLWAGVCMYMPFGKILRPSADGIDEFEPAAIQRYVENDTFTEMEAQVTQVIDHDIGPI